MLGDVMKRLEALGFTVTSVDEWVLKFCIDKVENHIKNNCNLTAVPKGLYEIAVDLICVLWALRKKCIALMMDKTKEEIKRRA